MVGFNLFEVLLISLRSIHMKCYIFWSDQSWTGIDQFGAFLPAALTLSLPDHSFPCSSSRLKISSIGHEKDIDSVQTDEHGDEY